MTRVSEFFSRKNPNLKKMLLFFFFFFFFFGGGRGGGVGVGEG